MTGLDLTPTVLAALALSLPAMLAVGSFALTPSTALARARQRTLFAWVAASLLAAGSLGAALLGDASTARGPTLGVRLDGVTLAMTMLVTSLGVVVARYSASYLRDEPRRASYARWFLRTLAAVLLLVVSNDLVVMGLAWLGASLCLHRLLTFYPDRPAALLAAHKKFLLSRCADACVAVAIALVGTTVGSVELDALDAWVGARESLPAALQVAALLFVIAVALKSAQLPFHGWLTQVMEAPTPVSALLHAGIVNVGGLVMIRLAPLMAEAQLAQTVLVAIGASTTLLAGLVMTTRSNVKAALAWSTCAQMGFMLVECGLGLWDLALLHLVAHSLYKAHAFLGAGGAVHRWRSARLVERTGREGSSWTALAALFAGVGLAVAVASVVETSALSSAPVRTTLAVILALGLAPSALGASRAPRMLAWLALRGFVAAGIFLASHAVAARLYPWPSFEPSALALALAVSALVASLALQRPLRSDGRLARALGPWLFAGLFLDERFTRLTFRVWPPRLPRRDAPSLALPLREPAEA